MRYRWAVLAAPALVAGCAAVSAPWSEVTGERYNLAIENRRSVAIVSVGSTTGWARPQALTVDPGRQRVVVESHGQGSFRVGRVRELELDVAPCRRYYVNAQFDDPVSSDFRPVVDHVESIPGCGTPRG
ncbi:hypothetical protein BURK1_02721 [Burkholderiales bacterium]|nr:hypothetical protein BURK1_02721 [Burkholderiales bacterium]